VGPTGPFGGILGTSTVQNITYGEDTTVGQAVIAPGQTFEVYTVPGGALSSSEIMSMATLVLVAANLAPITITGATNASPVVLTLSNTTGLASGDLARIAGVGGNTAANGTFFYSVSGSTISLYHDEELSQPVVGNGSYTSGGTVTSLAFGHFQRQVTYRECFGSVLNAQEGTLDTDITTPVPPSNITPSLAATVVSITSSAESIVVDVTAPPNVGLLAAAAVSYLRWPPSTPGSAPTLISSSVSTGPSDGGTTGTLTMTSSAGLVGVTLDGVAASARIVNSTTIAFKSSPGPAFGGTGDIVVQTVSGNSNALTNAWTYTSTPLSILGGKANVAFLGYGSSLGQVAGTVTSWNDVSGNGQNIPAVGTPTYNSSSTHITPNGPTVSCSGAAGNGFILPSTFVLGGAATPLFMWTVARQTTSGGLATLLSYQGGFTDYLHMSSTSPALGAEGGADLIWGSSIIGQTLAIAAYSDGAVGAGCTQFISVSNGTPVTQTISGSANRAGTGNVSIGIRADNVLPSQTEFAVVLFANIKPSSPQLAALETWAQVNLGVP
jgi:hypothetical protein